MGSSDRGRLVAYGSEYGMSPALHRSCRRAPQTRDVGAVGCRHVRNRPGRRTGGEMCRARKNKARCKHRLGSIAIAERLEATTRAAEPQVASGAATGSAWAELAQRGPQLVQRTKRRGAALAASPLPMRCGRTYCLMLAFWPLPTWTMTAVSPLLFWVILAVWSEPSCTTAAPS